MKTLQLKMGEAVWSSNSLDVEVPVDTVLALVLC